MGKGEVPNPREGPPHGPLSLCAPALPARPTGPTSGFHFLLQRERMKRVNNKTLRCEVNRAVRSVGRAGLGLCGRRRDQGG